MRVKLRRNRHNMSNYNCGTCYSGEIVPVGYTEVLPGDSNKHRVNGLIRFAALNAPVMHRVNAEYFTFYVPWRIVWDGFEDFITRVPGADTPPVMTLGGIKDEANCKRLCEYLGLNTDPVVTGSTTEVNILKLWAYYAIYNEWFRDKDLTVPMTLNETPGNFEIKRACWHKDNYTLARSEPQYGADVTIPLGSSAPVVVDQVATVATGTPYGDIQQKDGTGGNPGVLQVPTAQAINGSNPLVEFQGTADLTNAAGSVIAFRRAMNLQALAERLQNFGHDYRSMLASMGVQSDDGRLQKPELLGSGKVPISFSEVLQTAEGSTTGVGDMYGHGIAAAKNHAYRRFFKEHGCIMTVMVVRPRSIYNNIIERDWYHGLVDGANDYYTPELERIGFQEIKNKELYPTNPAGGDETTWGYGPRYMEYRQSQSHVSGLFKVGESLDYWTWARGFDGVPALNETWAVCEPDPRIFQNTSEQHILFAVNHINIFQRMLTKNITGRII